jgi:hypothetical protein
VDLDLDEESLPAEELGLRERPVWPVYGKNDAASPGHGKSGS